MASRIGRCVGVGAVALIAAEAAGFQQPPHHRHLVGGAPESKAIVGRALYGLKPNQDTKFPDWVAYVATDLDRDPAASLPAPTWQADPSIDADSVLEPDDFGGGTYEPVGLVDRELFNVSPVLDQADFISHVVPQKANLKNVWIQLDELIRQLREDYAMIWVIAGPYYDGNQMAPLPDADETHRVPSGYWKVIAAQRPDGFHINCFLFRQDVPTGAAWHQFRSNLAVIEAKTGLDLFPNAPHGTVFVDPPRASCNQCTVKAANQNAAPQGEAQQIRQAAAGHDTVSVIPTRLDGPGKGDVRTPVRSAHAARLLRIQDDVDCRYLLDCLFCLRNGSWVKETPEA